MKKCLREIKTKYGTVRFDDSKKTRDAVFEKLIAFYVKHEAFAGESIMQCDNPQIEAAPLLSDIADDLIKFDVTWDDE